MGRVSVVGLGHFFASSDGDSEMAALWRSFFIKTGHSLAL